MKYLILCAIFIGCQKQTDITKEISTYYACPVESQSTGFVIQKTEINNGYTYFNTGWGSELIKCIHVPNNNIHIPYALYSMNLIGAHKDDILMSSAIAQFTAEMNEPTMLSWYMQIDSADGNHHDIGPDIGTNISYGNQHHYPFTYPFNYKIPADGDYKLSLMVYTAGVSSDGIDRQLKVDLHYGSLSGVIFR